MSAEAAPVERSIFIEAEPETVFGFLVAPALTAEWFGISHVLDVKVGTTWPACRRERRSRRLAGDTYSDWKVRKRKRADR